MEEKLVSVIVPVYNVESYLKECLDSVVNQTHKNLEILIVNDGSTDNSLAILQEFEKKDSRIRVWTKENGGLSSARNYAIDRSKGEFLTFIDSDDYVEKNYVEVLLRSLLVHNADVSIVNFFHVVDTQENRLINADGSIREYTVRDILVETYSSENNFTSVLQMAQCKLYKRELFSDVRYPFGRKYEDSFTTYKLFLKSNKIVYVHDDLYAYRMRSGSITNSGYSLSNLDVIDMFEERIKLLQKEGYSVFLDRYYYCVKLLKEYSLLKIYFPNHRKKDELKEKYIKEKKSIYNDLDIKKKMKLMVFEAIASLAPRTIITRLFL